MPSITNLGLSPVFGRRGGWERYWAAQKYTDAEIQALIDSGYVPVADASDIYAINTTYSGGSTRNFAVGTQWETGAINTTGLAGSYIQVANINLDHDTMSTLYGDVSGTDGSWYSESDGWVKLGTFTGIYDGGGLAIQNLYYNRPTEDYYGLFMRIRGTFKNLYIDGNVIGNTRVGILCGLVDSDDMYMENIAVGGFAYTTDTRIGGLISEWLNGAGNAEIKNCISFVNISTSEGATLIGGSVFGYATNTQKLTNVFACGYVPNVGFSSAIGGYNVGTIIANDCYYDNERAERGKGFYGIGDSEGVCEGKTTTEALALKVSEWDTDIWNFLNGRYPILAKIGEVAGNRPSPTQMVADIVDSVWTMTWTAPSMQPLGYYLYQSFDGGAWERVGTMITDTETTIETPAAEGTYRYCVTAVYTTSNGVTAETVISNISEMQERFDKAKFVFTTDDGCDDNYDHMYPLYEEKSIKGVFYVPATYFTGGARLSWAEAIEMHNDGHLIMSHGYDHTRLTDLNEAQLNTDFTNTDTAFTTNGLPAPAHIAYPFGSSNELVWTVAADYYSTGRVSAGFAHTFPDTDKFLIKPQRLDMALDDEDSLQDIKDVIDYAIWNKTAVVFDGHGALPDDEMGAATDKIQLSYLEEIIDYIQARDADIITIEQLYQLMV